MKNTILRVIVIVVLLALFRDEVHAQRNWLTQDATPEQLSSYLSSIDTWRQAKKQSIQLAIDHLPQRIKQSLIKQGTDYLSFTWPALPASRYLEFGQNGNRTNFQSLLSKRRAALSALVIAELIEGDGRFMPQIINGIWATCEESTWAYPAHLALQRKYTPLPNPGENIIDLGSGTTAALISWTYFLLHDKLDSVTAVLPLRIKSELEQRIIDPYLQRDDFWWMGFHGQSVNNWNPWVNGNVLLTSLLIDDDSKRMTNTIYKTMRSVDYFINQYPDDGGCDEGPSYWSEAGGALISYLGLLKEASLNKIDIASHPLICNMGRYIYKMNIAGNYFVDFADAHPEISPDITSVFDFGKSCNSDTLKQFAAYFANQRGTSDDYFLTTKGNLQHFINYLSIYEDIRKVSPKEPLIKEAWLPDLQVLTVRSVAGSAEGLFLAAKGGTNGDSHNHNDVGNFIIYQNGKPAIIDIGVGTYTRETFSKDRYKIFTMQSAWHNLPTINGIMQHEGGNFKAKNVQFSSGKKGTSLSMDIAAAYPAEAGVKSWVRRINFNGARVTLTEKYQLNKFQEPSTLSLITPLKATKSRNHIVLEDSLGHRALQITFDPSQMDVNVETKILDDPPLQRAWGNELKRIIFSIKSHKLSNTYQLYFQAL